METCTNPNWSLKKQMTRSFITLCVVSLTTVFAITCINVLLAGSMTESETRNALKGQIRTATKNAALQTAQVIDKRIKNLAGVVELVEQNLLDHMDGYGDPARLQQYKDDSGVAFADARTKRRGYPLEQRKTFLDWDAKLPGSQNGMKSSSPPKRWDYHTKISDTNSMFFFQGACDPGATAPQPYRATTANVAAAKKGFDGSKGSYGPFFPGCRPASNDFKTGGTVSPTDKVESLADKSAHLDYILKTAYEGYSDIQAIGMWFYNDGKCALRYFPGLNPIPFGCYNPVTCRPQDKCRSVNTEVCGRDYNCVERPWFQEAIKLDNIGKVIHNGPYRNAWAGDKNVWILSFAKAIYDRTSNKLIGVATVDIEIAGLQQEILNVKIGAGGRASLVGYNSGTVVADEGWNSASTKDTAPKISDLGNGVTKALWKKLQTTEDSKSFEEYTHNGREWYVARSVISSHESNSATGYPIYMVLVHVPKDEVEKPILTMVEEIQADQTTVILISLVIVVVAILFISCAVMVVSSHITKPLREIVRVADLISDRAGEKDLVRDPASIKIENGHHKEGDNEIGDLVGEFNIMVQGLTSKGASKAIHAKAKAMPANPFHGPDGRKKFYKKD